MCAKGEGYVVNLAALLSWRGTREARFASTLQGRPEDPDMARGGAILNNRDRGGRRHASGSRYPLTAICGCSWRWACSRRRYEDGEIPSSLAATRTGRP